MREACVFDVKYRNSSFPTVRTLVARPIAQPDGSLVLLRLFVFDSPLKLGRSLFFNLGPIEEICSLNCRGQYVRGVSTRALTMSDYFSIGFVREKRKAFEFLEANRA